MVMNEHLVCDISIPGQEHSPESRRATEERLRLFFLHKSFGLRSIACVSVRFPAYYQTGSGDNHATVEIRGGRIGYRDEATRIPALDVIAEIVLEEFKGLTGVTVLDYPLEAHKRTFLVTVWREKVQVRQPELLAANDN